MHDSIKDDAARQCPICLTASVPAETQLVRCNVRRFRDRHFLVWRCGRCRSLHCENVSDLAQYYENYPIRQQTLDYFLRTWYRVVLKRLEKCGLKRGHSILDYGCNQGLLLHFLRENGFSNCSGYDPYVEKYSSTEVLDSRYDLVICLDVIEHDVSPRDFFARLARLLKPSGQLCIETPNAEGIELTDVEEYLHALHMPFHVHIMSERALTDISALHKLAAEATYRRWYMDSWHPGTARRLFETLLKFGDNDLDSGYERPRIDLFFRHPVLLIYLFLGYFIPPHKEDHLMMIFAAKP